MPQEVPARGEAEVVADELALLASLVPLEGARVAELGCGAGDFARRLAAHPGVRSVTAYEVDAIQHAKNVASARPERLGFAEGGAQSIALADASLDGVVMMKSLHHVPVAQLDAALAEIARVLVPGGWLYVSEPLFQGELNEVIRLFHDERVVRTAAYEALQRAHRSGLLRQERELHFLYPRGFRDFADFEAKTIRATHTNHRLSDGLLAQVRERFERHAGPQGAKFLQPMRVNLLRRAH